MTEVIVINDLTGPRLVLLIVVFAFGYLLHEFMHILPLRAVGVPYRVEFAPGDSSTLYSVFIGRMFVIEPIEPIGPWLALAYNLAPGVLTLPGWWLWAEMLQASVISLSSALLVGVWIVIFMPSLVDLREAYKSLALLRRGEAA